MFDVSLMFSGNKKQSADKNKSDFVSDTSVIYSNRRPCPKPNPGLTYGHVPGKHTQRIHRPKKRLKFVMYGIRI